MLIREVRQGVPITATVRKYFSVRYFFKGWREAVQELDTKTIRDWRKNYDVFSKALVKEAEESKLESASLAKILKLILEDPENKDIALLPVSAHSMKLDGEPVWIVTLKWEMASAVVPGGTGVASLQATLAHERDFTFTQKTLKKVGFITCD